MEQNILLTTEHLKVCAELQRGCISRGAFVIKNVPAQLYLTVSNEQAVALDAFAQGATVPEAFASLLRERRCLPLREFYELVLKALQAGVLFSGAARKPPRHALTWLGWSPGLRGLWPAVALNLVVLGGLAWRADVLAGQWTVGGLFLGVLLASAALSLGQALAGVLLVGVGGEVYARRRVESLAVLHLRFDLGDARLLRPVEQAWIALAGTLPLAVALLVFLTIHPAVVAPLTVAWMLIWRPWGDGLPRRLAALLSRYPRLDTDSKFLFHVNRRPHLHWRPWWRRWDWRVCGLELVCAAAWTCLLARLAMSTFGVGFVETITADSGYWQIALPGVVSALLIALMVVMIRRWRDGVQAAWRSVRQRWDLYRRRRREPDFPDTEAAMLRVAATHPLFSLLNPYDQAELVRSWRPELYPTRTEIATRGEEGGVVGIILSGRVVAGRKTPSGRRVRVYSFEEGDLFGVSNYKGDGWQLDGALDLRTATPVSAMLMPAGLFRSRVLDKLGAGLVYDMSYKRAFLQRLKLCAHWDAHAVGRFARLSRIVSYSDGQTIIREGEEPRWLFIVYQGVAQVRRREKLLPRLKQGDFFGEISLLQNSVATADVLAQGEVRCLQIDRSDFLRFMTHNHHVALALERISSARLGHPIFPLSSAPIASSHSFANDSRRNVCYS